MCGWYRVHHDHSHCRGLDRRGHGHGRGRHRVVCRVWVGMVVVVWPFSPWMISSRSFWHPWVDDPHRRRPPPPAWQWNRRGAVAGAGARGDSAEWWR